MHPRAFVLCAALLIGCGGVDATNVATSDINATFRVTASGDGSTYAEAILLVANGSTSPQYVSITETEALEVSVEDQTVALDQETQGVILYSALIDRAPLNEEFTFSYTRDAWPSALASTASLPPMADSISASTEFDPDTSLDVTWPTTEGSARVSVSGDCIETYATEVSLDAGMHTVPGSEILPRGEGTECAVDVELFAENEGQVDEAFNPQSSIRGRSRRSTTATWTP